MLNNSVDGMLDLQQEIDYLHNYIDIYRMRFEDVFFVDFKVSGDLAGKKIASLILIPFVENAFKHGVSNDERVPINIHIDTSNHQLQMLVNNKISRGQKDGGGGIGLVNIKRRLELIYPDRFELLVNNDGDTYGTKLKIRLDQ